LQNAAATLGGHAGAKAVGALSVNDAGLESPLHDNSLKNEIERLFLSGL
jgi:hypothetical protein